MVAEIFQYKYFEVVFQSKCWSKAGGQVLQYKCTYNMYRIITGPIKVYALERTNLKSLILKFTLNPMPLKGLMSMLNM